MAELVDWRYAQSTASLLGKTGPKCSATQAGEMVRSLRQLAEAAGEHVTAVTGLDVALPLAPVRVVDRQDWVAVNAAGFQAVIEPALARHSKKSKQGTLIRTVSSATSGMQLGAAMALVSSRVLGQYELFSTTPGQLLLVAPNILSAEQKLDVDPYDFRLWVCLHEVTHQLQFTAVPWLRSYFLSELEALLSTRSPLELLRSEAKRQQLSAITALMTLVEGHAEYVMDAVGPHIVPTVEVIRKKFDARRRSGNPVQQVLRYLLGVEHKLRQYVEGKKFVTSVVDAVGMAGFNTVWRDATTLPTRAELAQPEVWLARVRPTVALG